MGEYDNWGRQDPIKPQPSPAQEEQSPPAPPPTGAHASAESPPAAAESPPAAPAPVAAAAAGDTWTMPAGTQPYVAPSGSVPVSPYASPYSQPSYPQASSYPQGSSYPAGAYPQGSSYSAGAYPQGSYPTGSYPTGSYPTSAQPAATQPTGYQNAPTYQNTPGGPYQNAPAGPYQQGGYPGGPGAPTPASSSGGGRVAKVTVIAIAAVALALCSGVAGGLFATGVARPAPAQTVTRAAAPQVDRSSVAGVAETVLPSVVDISTGEGEGSGVILSSDGSIVTNNHVVAGADGASLEVTFSDGKTAKATIVGTDPVGDIAVVKAQGVSGLTAAKFGDSDGARVGDTVLAIGSPLGLQGSVSEGIVSALHRTIDEPSDASGSGHSIGDAIQTDAAINPGNSGGALVNLAGEVIGINTAIATSGQGAGNIGVGFAISGNRVKAAADQLLKGQKVSHPYMGVQVADGTGGALIADVVAGGPAAKGGLQKGDIVTKAGSQTVKDASDLVAAIQADKSGDQLTLTVQRGGAAQQVTVTLGDTP